MKVSNGGLGNVISPNKSRNLTDSEVIELGSGSGSVTKIIRA